jgi:catechol 2,3-dioxygenase-like lactoylglutathione lyase family enzyme
VFVTETTRRRFIRQVITGGGAASTAIPAFAQSSPIRSLDHVALPMQNVGAMLAFYRALGFQVDEGPQICVVRFGAQMINLHRPELWKRETFTLRAPAAAPPCGDLCFVWEGSAAALKAMLERVPAKVVEGPVNRQGGRRTTGVSTYIRDPDGNLLEFIVYA